MDRNSANKKAAIVIVLGVGPEYRAQYEGMTGAIVQIHEKPASALGRVHGAKVVAFDVDEHPGFLDDLGRIGFTGQIVPIARSRATMNTEVHFRGTKMLPACHRTAPRQVEKLLASQ